MRKNPTAAPAGRVQKNPGKTADKSKGYMGRPMGRVGGGRVADFAGRPAGTTTGHGLPAPSNRGGGSTGRRGNFLGKKAGY